MLPSDNYGYGGQGGVISSQPKPKVKAPSEITIKWLIERDACKEGMLRFLAIFISGSCTLTEYSFGLFCLRDQQWLRAQIEGPLLWENQEYHRQRGLAKLTKEEKEALGL